MAELQADLKLIRCTGCDKVELDDGQWNMWWSEGAPIGRPYYVCHRCLYSRRSYWNDLFSLSQKAGVGAVSLPRGLQPPTSHSLEGGSTSQNQSGDALDVKKYKISECPFEHSRLGHEQIRLLSLLPGEGDLFCTMEKVDLNSAAEQYQALSYCWGGQEQPKKTIWIDGHPFEILSNLYAALLQLRKLDPTRKLWIDAICISQVGDKGRIEKNAQIPLMGRIYHQAASVIVWLGSEEDNSDEVIDIIAQESVHAMRTPKFFMEFGKLLKRPWFHRTWIIQEFVLGKSLPQILCGSRVVSYGKLIATYLVISMLTHDSPDMYISQVRHFVDSNGKLVASRTSKMLPSSVWDNLLEADETFNRLTLARHIVLNIEGSICHQPLYKILPLIKAFDALDSKDKIYGVFGMVSSSVHQYVQVDYGKSVPEVYRDAMIYMLRQGPDAINLYLEFPLSLSLNLPTPGLPSWVPDFSRNDPFARYDGDITWHAQYHQNAGLESHTPMLRGRSEKLVSNSEKIHADLILMDDTWLGVRGFLVDEVDAVIESKLFSRPAMRDYSERQLRSSSESSQKEGQQIKRWLDAYEKTEDHTVPEITFYPDDSLSAALGAMLVQKYRTNSLYEINELCRQKFSSVARDLGSQKWLTFVWRDLLESYPILANMSEEEFNEQFYRVAGSDEPMTGDTWVSKRLNGQVKERNAPQLGISMHRLFEPPRSFFTTATSGFYGISSPGVRKGDKLVFLFPPVYMAFIIRPVGDNYQMLGPCLVPPGLRDRTLEKLRAHANEGEKFVFI